MTAVAETSQVARFGAFHPEIDPERSLEPEIAERVTDCGGDSDDMIEDIARTTAPACAEPVPQIEG